jgi:hypothetical protein
MFGQNYTWSIQSGLTVRFDYIFPCNMLFSNILTSQVFRTDVIYPTPAGLLQWDDKTASDHLPVLMVFKNPFDTAYNVRQVTKTDQTISLNWDSAAGRQYNVEASTNLANSAAWVPLVTNIVATGTNSVWSTNITSDNQFFRIYRTP